MRSIGGLVGAVLALAAHNPVKADSTVDYVTGGGVSSNIFQDTTALSAAHGETKLGLRGTLDGEEGRLAYRLAVSAKEVPRYDFADERTAGVEFGYERDLLDGVTLTLKGAIEHRRSGDIFLALPGALIGYTREDLTKSGSIGITAGHGGGKSSLTLGLSDLDRGKAHFTLPLLRPTRLEADDGLLDLTAGHIRPLLGGEVGVTVQYRASRIPSRDRKAFDRFPAETLRGSLAYGREIGGGVTLIAEAGLVKAWSAHLGASARDLRPFLKGQATWRPREGLTLTARYTADMQLTGLDDALGEYVQTVGLSAEKTLTERLKAGIAFEQAYGDWLYYDYRTRTRTFSATLTLALGEKHALALEYSRLLRRERDKAADFSVDGLVARLSGSF